MSSRPQRPVDNSNSDGHRFQVLSLDGGGLKGAFTAGLLAGLEQDLGMSITDHFDLIAGTSTGGVVALALGAGLSATVIADLYKDLGADVFRDPIGWRRLRRLVHAKYGSAALRKPLERALGGRTMADSRIRLVIPAFDLDTNAVYVVKTPHHRDYRRDWRIPMVDVALATTAAPTYFPAAQIGGVRLIDGGVWANNPSVVGLTEAVAALEAPLESVRIFSVGTTAEARTHSRTLDRGGIGPWGRCRRADFSRRASDRRPQPRPVAVGRRPVSPCQPGDGRGPVSPGPCRHRPTDGCCNGREPVGESSLQRALC